MTTSSRCQVNTYTSKAINKRKLDIRYYRISVGFQAVASIRHESIALAMPVTLGMNSMSVTPLKAVVKGQASSL